VTQQADRADAVKTLGELIKDIRFAMLTTVEDDGSLRGRPMATQQAEFDGDLWCFTGAGSAKVDEIQRERQVNVTRFKLLERAGIVTGTSLLP
jgi:general stress protein 26